MDTNDIRLNPFLLKEVHSLLQTLDLIQAAVDVNPKAVCFIKRKYDTSLDGILEYCASNDPESICYLPRPWIMAELILAWQVMIEKNSECIMYVIRIDYDFIAIWKETQLPIISKIMIESVEKLASSSKRTVYDNNYTYPMRNLHIIFTIFHKELSKKAISFIFNELLKNLDKVLYIANYSDEMMQYIDTYIPFHEFDDSYYIKYDSNEKFKQIVERMLDYDFEKYSDMLEYTSDKANLELVKRDINIIRKIYKKYQSLDVVTYVLGKDPGLRMYCSKLYATMVLGEEIKTSEKEIQPANTEVRSYLDQSGYDKKTCKKDVLEMYEKDRKEYLADPDKFNLRKRHEFFLSDSGLPLPYEYNKRSIEDVYTSRLSCTYASCYDSIGKTIHRATHPRIYGGAIGGIKI